MCELNLVERLYYPLQASERRAAAAEQEAEAQIRAYEAETGRKSSELEVRCVS